MAKNLRAFRIEDDIWNRAVAQSQRDGLTVSEILRDSLTRYVRVSAKGNGWTVHTIAYTKGKGKK
jgi:antitoxin component of RelBE/YafQ-DinJ toxin-antitoxin module